MALDMSEFLKGMESGRQVAMQAAAKAVDVFAEQVIGDAQQLCPVATGALQGSGTTAPIVVEGESITKEIGFNTNYAVYVHENLEAQHSVGQAKFLSAAMQSDQPKLGPFIANAVKEALG